MEITITYDELNKHAKKYFKMPYITGYADIAEDLGECLGVGGIQDEHWYFENVDQAEEYLRKDYNFESDLLAMSDTQYRTVLANVQWPEVKGDGVHTLAASHALNHEEDFASLIEAIRDRASDYGGGNEDVYTVFPEYAKKVQEYRDDAEKDMRRDFVRGDYHGNFEGLERLLVKEFEADEAEVTYDTVTLTWGDDATLKELMRDYYGRADLRKVKPYVLDSLVQGAQAYQSKKRQENEKRKAENERVRAYQKERDERAAAERRAKLDAIRPKKK